MVAALHNKPVCGPPIASLADPHTSRRVMRIIASRDMLERPQLRKGVSMPLEVLPIRFNMVGDDAIMVIGAGSSKQAVVVTKAAIKDVQLPATDHASAPQHDLATIGAIASSKFDKGMIAFDGRVWVTADDIRDWRRVSG